MRRFYALGLAVFLTIFLVALALGFAHLSSERPATGSVSYDNVTGWKAGA